MMAVAYHTCADPRGSGGTLDVEFEIEHYGSPARTFCLPEDSEPGEPPEISLISVRADDDLDIIDLLTDDERNKIEHEIIEDYDFDQDDDY
ncbi:hypothetical protein [Methylobacterium jeotgali]|nr:hypothetical protein [Methylobacterium jeotgali]